MSLQSQRQRLEQEAARIEERRRQLDKMLGTGPSSSAGAGSGGPAGGVASTSSGAF